MYTEKMIPNTQLTVLRGYLSLFIFGGEHVKKNNNIKYLHGIQKFLRFLKFFKLLFKVFECKINTISKYQSDTDRSTK